MPGEYFETTASELDHYFGNQIGIVKIWLQEGKTEKDFKGRRDDFIEGLELAISQNLREFNGVTNEHLKEMVQLAKGKDLRDPEVVEAIFKRYHEIRDMHLK